ncbi:MAG TPA: TerC family protein, partial [Steroidobacteraceae bacterium]|nr:TerC family protein [Steroidobacteraceae bacterium]
IVLGIDNIIFISILVERLPPERRASARISGLALAMVTRIALLFSIVWLTRLVEPWVQVGGQSFSGRDLILLAGGLFLLGKSVLEIHKTLEGPAAHAPSAQLHGGTAAVVTQIALIDIVFSLDSVFTAVGLVRELPVMIAAIVVAILVMMAVSGSISAFISRHPTIKMLALSFLLLIGVALVGEGLHFEIPKGYLYFAMAFAFGVELINVRLRRRLDARAPDAADGKGTDESGKDQNRSERAAGQPRPPSTK